MCGSALGPGLEPMPWWSTTCLLGSRLWAHRRSLSRIPMLRRAELGSCYFDVRMRFKRNGGKEPQGGAAVVNARDEDLFAEIATLTEANRANRDRERERRLLRLRHLAGLRLLEVEGIDPEHPSPDFDGLPRAEGLPELTPD